ncbi:MAG: hypothetical protein M3R25_13230, partial [Bacteroidota bacterium]|nr:hypothetical protein [Bacteroidota bacterium]
GITGYTGSQDHWTHWIIGHNGSLDTMDHWTQWITGHNGSLDTMDTQDQRIKGSKDQWLRQRLRNEISNTIRAKSSVLSRSRNRDGQ